MPLTEAFNRAREREQQQQQQRVIQQQEQQEHQTEEQALAVGRQQRQQPAERQQEQPGAGEGRTVGDALAGVEARLQDKLVAELRLLETRLRAEVPFLFFI